MSELPEVYLDWNATTPPLPEVLRAMNAAAEQAWANPSSVHRAGRRARSLVEEAREQLAEALSVASRDVVFTSGGTEANNLALARAPAIVTSRLEHPSVVRAVEAHEGAGRPVEWLPVPESGRIDSSAIDAALSRVPAGAVVTLMAANHETGVLQPIEEAAALCHARGARLHVDAVQSFGKVSAPLELADSVAIAAHKIRGPKGIGALATRPDWAPLPVLRGGAQERGLRPGTLDPIAIAGFAVAIRHARQGPARYVAVAALRDMLESRLSGLARINGSVAERLPHVSNLSVPGWKGDELVAALDLLGVRIASGSACSAGTTEVSPVITAMLGQARAASAIRVSLGDETTARDVERALAAFNQVVGLQSSRGSGSA